MPTTVTFSPRNPDLITNLQQMKAFSDFIIKSLAESNARCAKTGAGYGVIVSRKYFQIEFKSLSIEQEESSNFLVSELSMVLLSIGMESLFFVSEIKIIYNQNDFIYDSFLENSQSNFSLLLANLGLDKLEIPEKYLCNLTGQLMDKPIYIKETPDAICDEAQLFNWMFKNDGFFSPYTRNQVEFKDIVHDHILDEEIKTFVAETVTIHLSNQREQEKIKKEKLEAILTQYKQPDASILCLGVALRRAAALNHLENLKFLIALDFDINIQDTNPQNQKTALHWAAKNGHSEVAKLLINAGARFDIFDAFKKTAIDYAQIENNSEILTLFGQEPEEDPNLVSSRGSKR